MAPRTPPGFMPGDTAENDRNLLAALIGTPGIVGAADLLVTANGTPNMTVNVAAGAAFIKGTETTYQGMYHAFNDAPVSLAIAASDPTNPRIDIVVAQVRDADYSGANRDFRLVVVTGTPAGSPAAPATPADSIVLARVAVAANVTTVVAGNITDYRAMVGLTPSVAAAEAANPQGTLPGGFVAVTANQASITTLTDLTGLAVTVTVAAGRRIRISFHGLFQSNTAADTGQVEIHEGATRLQVGATALPVVSTNYSIPASVILTPSTGSHTYKIQAQRILGSSLMTLSAAAGLPAYILVEDIGV